MRWYVFLCGFWLWCAFYNRSLNGPYADHILIPRGSTGSSTFLISNESPYFSSCKSKISASILCRFGDMTKNVKLIGIPENNFLCIFRIASSPGMHTLFCLWRVNKKLPQGETSQNAFQRSRSINKKWKIYMLKWAYPPLRSISFFCQNVHNDWLTKEYISSEWIRLYLPPLTMMS